VLGKGNADAYVGLRINFIPHASPVLVLYNDDMEEGEPIDLAPMSFNDLMGLMESNGFKKKEFI